MLNAGIGMRSAIEQSALAKKEGFGSGVVERSGAGGAFSSTEIWRSGDEQPEPRPRPQRAPTGARRGPRHHFYSSDPSTCTVTTGSTSPA